MRNRKKTLFVAASALAIAAIAAPQVGEVLKILGVGAVVQKFGPQINTGINKLANHHDTANAFTKVVPIISVGSRRAIGAAQVMGSKVRVQKVTAVAQLDQDILGREVKIRALIPVSSNEMSNIRKVEGVGVSGIVDLKVRL